MREVPTWSEYLDRATRGDYDLALLGWQADTTDPNDFLSALLASDVDRHHEPQPLPQPGHGRPPEARAHGQRPGLARAARTARPRPSSRGTCRGCPSTTCSVFTAYRRSVRGLALGPTGLLRYDKAWKLP